MGHLFCTEYYEPSIYEKVYTELDEKNYVDFVDSVLSFAELYEKEIEINLKEYDFPLFESMGRFSGKTHYNFNFFANSGAKHNKNHNSTKQRLLHRLGRLEKNSVSFLRGSPNFI